MTGHIREQAHLILVGTVNMQVIYRIGRNPAIAGKTARKSALIGRCIRISAQACTNRLESCIAVPAAGFAGIDGLPLGIAAAQIPMLLSSYDFGVCRLDGLQLVHIIDQHIDGTILSRQRIAFDIRNCGTI